MKSYAAVIILLSVCALRSTSAIPTNVLAELLSKAQQLSSSMGGDFQGNKGTADIGNRADTSSHEASTNVGDDGENDPEVSEQGTGRMDSIYGNAAIKPFGGMDSMFGSPAGKPFGGSDSMFGSSGGKPFGGSDSMFGSPAGKPFGGSDSMFGSPAGKPYGGSDSMFGNPVGKPYGGSDSVFGNPPGKPFGGPDSMFGSPAGKPYGGSDSMFGSPAGKPYGGLDSMFGSSGGKPYGGSDSMFGNPVGKPFGGINSMYENSPDQPFSYLGENEGGQVFPGNNGGMISPFGFPGGQGGMPGYPGKMSPGFGGFDDKPPSESNGRPCGGSSPSGLNGSGYGKNLLRRIKNLERLLAKCVRAKALLTKIISSRNQNQESSDVFDSMDKDNQFE